MNRKISKRVFRHKRVRAKITGTASRPRFAVSRSNKHVFLQMIDDEKGKTIIGLTDTALAGGKKKITKSEKAHLSGKVFAEHAIKKGIKEVVFDRGGFKYQGRVKKIAEGAREGGLKF
ncbi:50S ribosomal protein L18 [Candidatus Giovannonibacteria bacterium RIFCSPHIGHO2_01_FULL_45_33]|uniref:Large ribosomal subunit protein uL18 n=1 Tax=Candidatus Giovannonibacteria bacterium RIFCSPLOWO2_01_FULL_45_34 TaxID=1798351 RepID=A0A1F5X099_9BACT|nr:MAG: 50S ribosomal protein L18 [Candidatus Giovannonibacteria bacterium RIFCSPHIGHO2_01_FULL_45_33]OGF81273.1 MAG: 50S ribosomal protein L18 [Candidatus Giovannonibacteria bacterium RIFCSPLOWO2_01_FULL_45_34]